MKIGAASLNQTPIDWAGNRQNIIDTIREAKKKRIDLLCLPELCITGYGCEDLFLSPWITKRALTSLKYILSETKDIAVAMGLPYHLNGNVYNVMALVHDQNVIGFQAKQHLPKDGVHYEPRWFERWPSGKVESIEWDGDQYPFGDKTYQLGNQIIGFEICEDAWVTNRPACRLVEQKVDIILNPSASHFAMMKSTLREHKVVAASKEFNCTYVFANQLGNEAGRIIYDGDAVIAHKGKLAASNPLFSFKNFELTAAVINYEEGSIVESAIMADHANQNEQFSAAVSLGLFDYLRKSRSKGFVLSLSGGADSSACLILMNEMVRRGRQCHGDNFGRIVGIPKLPNDIKGIASQLITTAYQGTDHSSNETLNSARELALSIGATFYHWTIQHSFEEAKNTIEQAIGRSLNWQVDDITLQNIQARMRSPLIWMLANITNSLLITTSNRSEGAVGYATMDGDTSGSLAPIAGVSKPFLLQWLKWAETTLNYPSLHYVNSLTPTAELRPQDMAQSDETDLMPYDVLNKIEELFILEKLTPGQIHERLSEVIQKDVAASYVIRFFELWSRNQWKRERIAPSFHLDDHNIDPRSWYRHPILSGGFKDELDELRKLSKK